MSAAPMPSPSVPETPMAGDLWDTYGRNELSDNDRIALEAPLAWGWHGGIGPGVAVLGELAGRRVVDLGCGLGRNAAHLAAVHGALCLGIDSSPSMHARAQALWASVEGVQFVHGDVVEHLRSAPAGEWDVILSCYGAVDFTNPDVLFPAVHRALRPGGLLAFSTLAAYTTGHPASTTPQPATIPAKDPAGRSASLQRWVLRPEVWKRLLTRHGFHDIRVHHLEDLDSTTRVPSQLTTARRPGPGRRGRLHGRSREAR